MGRSPKRCAIRKALVFVSRIRKTIGIRTRQITSWWRIRLLCRHVFDAVPFRPRRVDVTPSILFKCAEIDIAQIAAAHRTVRTYSGQNQGAMENRAEQLSSACQFAQPAKPRCCGSWCTRLGSSNRASVGSRTNIGNHG